MSDITLPHCHRESEQTLELWKQLHSADDFRAVAEVFRQLGDTTRIRIFWLLCHCEECVINLSAMLDLSSPAVSHHLRPLRESGLIVSRREGKEVYYRATDTPQSRLLHQMIEQVMEIACPRQAKETPREETGGALDRRCKKDGFAASCSGKEQEKIIHEIHEQLLQHMDRRYTIEALSRQYFINPTTLKSMFKSIYGTSIAAHIKEHRMEEAARLLRETNLSIASIADRVGYDSPSRLTAAFKKYYGKLPRDYRGEQTAAFRRQPSI